MKPRGISLLSSPKLTWIIIGFGILIRLIQYLYNRSLWADEAVLALNIVNRSYLELFQPLDYDQAAPIGFLLVEKLAVQLLGNNEYALRLLPLLSGIISLWLFYELAKQCIPKTAIPIALALFASLHYLVYYAAEVKQYSTDVAIALLSCLVAMHLGNPKLSRSQTLTFSLVGAVAIWFSHPAIFVLAGVGITSVLIGIVSKQQLKITNILLICTTWLLSFTVFYFGFLKKVDNNEDLLQSWANGFPSSLFDIIWLLDAFGKFFYKPLGFTALMDGIAIFAFLLGCISCFYRRKETLAILLSPLIATFVAAYLQKYPFRSRLVLFLTPFVILLIAEGVDYLRRKNRYKFTVIAGNVILILLLAPPLVSASNLLVNPYLREEIKPVISYVKTHQRPGDIIYIFQRGKYQFEYYAKRYGYQPGDYIIGVEDLDKYDGKNVSQAEWNRYKSDLDKLRENQRVWLIFSHAHLSQENAMINTYLDRIGKRIDTFQTTGAFVYLYNLTNKNQ
jgi:hypothetical protein